MSTDRTPSIADLDTSWIPLEWQSGLCAWLNMDEAAASTAFDEVTVSESADGLFHRSNMQAMPGELMNKIYEHLCVPAHVPTEGEARAMCIPAILQTCRKLRSESAGMWFSRMQFHYFELQGLVRFMVMLEPAHRRAIRYLVNTNEDRSIPRWRTLGMHHQFLQRLDLDFGSSVLYSQMFDDSDMSCGWRSLEAQRPDPEATRVVGEDIQEWEWNASVALSIRGTSFVRGIILPATDLVFFDAVAEFRKIRLSAGDLKDSTSAMVKRLCRWGFRRWVPGSMLEGKLERRERPKLRACGRQTRRILCNAMARFRETSERVVQMQ